MAGATECVRRALAELGPDAPDTEVKAHIRKKDPRIPEAYVSLALRKLRGKVVRAARKQPHKYWGWTPVLPVSKMASAPGYRNVSQDGGKLGGNSEGQPPISGA